MTKFRRGAFPPAPPERVVEPPDWSALRRWNAILAWCGIAAKSVLYLLLFLWGARTGTGAAALNGFLAADMATWVVFSAVEWHVRGFQIGLGAAFQAAVVLAYLARGDIFGMTRDPVEAGVSMLFFILFASVKGTFWAAEIVLEVTGVKEPEPE